MAETDALVWQTAIMAALIVALVLIVVWVEFRG